MEDLKKVIEQEALSIIENDNLNESKAQEQVSNMIKQEVENATNVKSALDLMFTHDALKDKETFDNALSEKKEELRNDAEAKRIEAETQRISKEVEKVKQEKEKQLAELDKTISAKKKEVEQLLAESDKEQAYFESNKDLLSYIGVKSKKTLKVMYTLMIPAMIIFTIVQLIALPITIGGKILELILDIVGGICGKITSNALKIVISLVVVAFLIGGSFCAYYFGGRVIL